MDALIIANCIVVALLVLVYLAKCQCGCWRWCKCAAAGCCCRNENMTEGVRINSTRTVTLHFTNWCPACKVMKPVWYQVKSAMNGSGVVFLEEDGDITKNPTVNGYPTIHMITESGETVDYHGGADFITLRNWIASPVLRKS